MNNVDIKCYCWFYFDIDYGKKFYLNRFLIENSK